MQMCLIISHHTGWSYGDLMKMRAKELLDWTTEIEELTKKGQLTFGTGQWKSKGK